MEYWIIGDEFLDEEPKKEADAQGYLKELVQCKDCKYFNKYAAPAEKYKYDGWCFWWGAKNTYSDWWCCGAKRREK